MAYIKGEARAQQTLFPLTLDELISLDHVCRVIEAFVNKLDVAGLGFLRAEPAETGRPGYDPRDLLKLYLYGYLQQVRSSRRLEAECRRNVEVMWLMGRLTPDYKSIAEFRRVHREAVTAAGAELVRLARQVGLVKGEWVAIDGSKFRAVSSADTVGEREAVQRYLEQLESADQQDEVTIDDTAVAAAMEKLKNDPEPEARFMRMAQNTRAPAYNVQTAVDATHGIIVAQQVTTEANDNRSLLPMAKAAKEALGAPESLNVIADAGYSNGEQAAECEAHGIVPQPANRTVNNKGDGTLFDRTLFVYDEKTDTFRCPAKQTLYRKQMLSRRKSILYAEDEKTCSQCPLKTQCTSTTRRFVQRHIHDAALQRMNARATAQAMRLRRCTVERPFALLKCVIFGHPRLLLRGVSGAQVEISLATMAYNLKTMMHVLGGSKLNNILTA